MVVDDEPHVRELLRDFLTGEGYEVVTVATGAQALETVPTFQPDVIFDALRRAGVTVPVILISGTPRLVEEGFFRVLRNPFDLRAIADVVAAAMGHGRTPGS